MHKCSAEFYSGRSAKKRNSNFGGFLKIKNSLPSFSLIIENSLLKGFSWQNMKKSITSVLDIYSPIVLSRTLQGIELGMKKRRHLTH